jgi:hypothetical protein
MATNFELVKRALDELYVIVKSEYGDTANAAILAQFEIPSGSYGALTSPTRKALNYSSAAARFAYVYTYFAAHCAWISEFLTGSEATTEALTRGATLRVTCLGGGPGTELIGLLNACSSLGRTEPLSCFLLDREDGWAETWAEFDSQVHAEFRVSTSVRSVDVVNPPGWKTWPRRSTQIYFSRFSSCLRFMHLEKARKAFLTALWIR